MSFRKKGKLSLRFIGPFEILRKMGEVASELALPPNLLHVHNVFHVSILRKYMCDPSHVLEFEPPQIREDLSYNEQPIQILDRKEQVLHSKVISSVKILWKNHSEEAIREGEDKMKEKYPHLFCTQCMSNSGTEFILRGEECNTPPNDTHVTVHVLHLEC